jgi:hypothetical protein
VLAQWIATLRETTDAQVITIDAKTLCRNFDAASMKVQSPINRPMPRDQLK